MTLEDVSVHLGHFAFERTCVSDAWSLQLLFRPFLLFWFLLFPVLAAAPPAVAGVAFLAPPAVAAVLVVGAAPVPVVLMPFYSFLPSSNI